MKLQEKYINSVNLNLHTDFPYLVLNVENDVSLPKKPSFRVMHWHEDLQFIYVISGKICVKTLKEEIFLGDGEGIFINKNVVHLVDKIDICKYKSFLFPDYFVSFYLGSPASRLTQSITDNKSIPFAILDKTRAWCRQALDILRELIALEKKKAAFTVMKFLPGYPRFGLSYCKMFPSLRNYRKKRPASARANFFNTFNLTITNLLHWMTLQKAHA